MRQFRGIGPCYLNWALRYSVYIVMMSYETISENRSLLSELKTKLLWEQSVEDVLWDIFRKSVAIIWTEHFTTRNTAPVRISHESFSNSLSLLSKLMSHGSFLGSLCSLFELLDSIFWGTKILIIFQYTWVICGESFLLIWLRRNKDFDDVLWDILVDLSWLSGLLTSLWGH